MLALDAGLHSKNSEQVTHFGRQKRARVFLVILAPTKNRTQYSAQT